MKVESYNFRKPGRLALELEHRLQDWLKAAGALAKDLWAKQFPFQVELQFVGFDQDRPGDALGKLGDTVVGYQAQLANELTTMLVIPRQLALLLIMGMQGDNLEQLPDERDFTALEQEMVEFAFQSVLAKVIQDSWPGIEPTKLTIGPRDPLPRRSRQFPVNRGLMVCTWQVTGSFGQAPVQWFVPQEGMFAILKRLVEQEESLQKKDYRSTLEQLVQEMPLEVSVTLGNAEVPLAQLARLRPGDVLILDQPVSEPLRAAIGEEKHFQVWPGRVGNRQALQVESFPES